MTELPEYHTHEEFLNRIKKLEEIRQLGVEPYPHRYAPTHTARNILEEFENNPVGDSEAAAQGNTPYVSVAGRLILFRAMGKNAFAHIQEATHKIQLMLNRDATHVVGLSENQEFSPLKFIEKKIDLGDWIGVEGNLSGPTKGSLYSSLLKKITLLCKSLLPFLRNTVALSTKR